MSSFKTPLRLEFLDGSKWRVLEEFDYYLDENNKAETIAVPAGFLTDFASIPRGLWNLLPPAGPYGKAAVVHDWLYFCLGAVGTNQIYSRAQCDAIFRDAMAVLGVPAWKRWTMYSAVRAFGWKPWGDHEKRRAMEK